MGLVTRLALGLLALIMTSCSVRIASLHAIAVDGVGTERLTAARLRGRGEGRACRWWVLGVPLGYPHIDDALRAALAGTRGIGLRNATVTSEHPVYGLVGRHCYRVRGEIAE